MKASEFINLMRKVIREEVRTIIKEELKDIRKPVIRESTKTQTQPAAITQVKQKPLQKRTIPPVMFEGPLGGLLNETYESMIAQPHEEEEWPDMNGGQLMTSQMFAGMQGGDGMSLNSLMSDDSPLPEMGGGYGDPTSQFIKDYSGVMKAADQHQGKL